MAIGSSEASWHQYSNSSPSAVMRGRESLGWGPRRANSGSS
jgi:hypothetical protein